MKKTLKLWVHYRSYSDSGDELLINAKEFPDIKHGDVVEIYHPEDEYSRLLLQVTNVSDEFQQKDTISIEQSIANQFQLRAYKDVIVNKVNPKDVALGLVELLFKDQYLSRSDMWRLRHGLVNTCAYLTKKLEAAEMRVQVNELWAKGERVTCGMITEDTRIVFRSSTAVVQICIQMSSEMWEFDINGDLYFEKAVNGFLTDLFAKWKEQNCLHDVTIVLFSRTFYDAQVKEEFPVYMRDCLQQDYQGRFYEDYYRVVVQNERYDDWTNTMKTLRKLFNEYPERVIHYHERTGQCTPKAWNSTAAQGNFLETLNMSLNLLEKYYVDRNFDRTGKVAVVITPGPGVFEVDRELTNITKQRTIDCGVGSDLVCMGEQPLHAAPLFKFHTKARRETQVGDDYNIPHWMNHSFYLSKNQIQARLRGSFVPRIKPPIQIFREKKPKPVETRDFTAYSSSCDSDDDNFPFVDYDEYDAQVFKLPAPNFAMANMQHSSKKGKKKLPQSFAEAKKERQQRGRVRCSSDDMSALNEKPEKKSQGTSPSISIPSRSSSGGDISTSVPAMDKKHLPAESSEDEDGVSSTKLLSGSAGASSGFSKRFPANSASRRALINPFAPSTMHFRMTSNRRRWIHAFPTDPHGAAVQTHHFHTYKEQPNEQNWSTPTKEVLQATQIAVEARRQRAATRQDSMDGSDGAGFESSGLIAESTDSGSPSLSYMNQIPGSSFTSTSYLQDLGNKPPSIKRLPKEEQRSWLWGPTGEQEWTPEMTTGVDWKSLTIPATLPITTDYFPGMRSLQMDYVINEYTLVPDDVNVDFSFSGSAEEKFFKRTILSSKQVYMEMISQRLSQGFQVIVMPSSTTPQSQIAISSSPQYQHAMGLIRARPRKEQSEEHYLSIGRIFHRLALSGQSIAVTTYKPKHPQMQMKVSYCYRFQAPDSHCYDVSWTEFRNEQLENYNWNYLDQYICTRGEGEYGLVDSLKFWRSRFIMMPSNNPATQKIISGSSSRCDIYEEKSPAELQQLINGFVRFLEILNKIKRTAKRTKLSGDQVTTANPNNDSDAAKSAPSTGEPNTGAKDDDGLSNTSPASKLVEALMDAQTGMPILTKQPGIPSNSFIAIEAVTWCKQNVRGVTSIKSAVELMQRLVTDQLVVHATGNPEHQFIYGFYFYYFTSPKDRSKDLGTRNITLEFIPFMKYMQNRTSYDLDFDGIILDAAIFDKNIPVSENFLSGPYSLFQNDFCEVTILPVEDQKPTFHLDDTDDNVSMTEINPEIEDWRIKTRIGFDGNSWGQLSATLLHKYVNVDVDVNDKSERPEWATARYHAYYSPLCGYQIQLQWMVATGSLLGELVYSWARKVSACGYHILPVPVDPFALPSSPNTDSLRGPIFIPLHYTCLTDLGMSSLDDTNTKELSRKLHDFQVSILKRYGFMPAGVGDSSDTASPAGQGEDYSHFVHCTAGMFILIEDSHVSSPTVKDAPFSTSFGKKSSSELRKDYIMRQQSSQPPQVAVEHQVDTENKVGFFWSWNFMSSKRWRSANTGDEAFQDKVLADLKKFCSNDENRLQEYWLDWYNPCTTLTKLHCTDS